LAVFEVPKAISVHSEQAQALARFRELAKPHRLIVRTDAEGFPVIPGRYGQIEWYCDGENCAARFGGFCALPGQLALAVYTERPRLFEKLWAIPGVKRHQTGDHEMRAVFPPEALEQAAAVIKARRKRILSPEAAKKLGARTAYRATSGHQKTLKSTRQAVTKG
jgi:hypothetical protein